MSKYILVVYYDNEIGLDFTKALKNIDRSFYEKR